MGHAMVEVKCAGGTDEYPGGRALLPRRREGRRRATGCGSSGASAIGGRLPALLRAGREAYGYRAGLGRGGTWYRRRNGGCAFGRSAAIIAAASGRPHSRTDATPRPCPSRLPSRPPAQAAAKMSARMSAMRSADLPSQKPRHAARRRCARAPWPRACAPTTSSVPARKLVPSRDGDRALGVLAQGHARHAEHGRLFLHAARVGEHDARLRGELEEVEIAERLDEPPAPLVGCSPPTSARRARVRGCTGKTSGSSPALSSMVPSSAASCAGSSTFDGRCSVTSDVAARRHAELLEDGRAHRLLARGQERVDHDVADEEGALGRHAFALRGAPCPPDRTRRADR